MDWESIPGFPGYEITRSGRVRSWWSVQTKRGVRLDRPQELRPHITGRGYTAFSVRVKGSGTRAIGVHRLLLTAFRRPPKDGEVGRHLDGDKTNNLLENLRWGSTRDNVLEDEIRLGNRPAQVANTIPAGVVRAVRKARNDLAKKLAAKYGIHVSSVYRLWATKGSQRR